MPDALTADLNTALALLHCQISMMDYRTIRTSSSSQIHVSA